MPSSRTKTIVGRAYFIQWASTLRMMRSSDSRMGISEEVWLKNEESACLDDEEKREEDIAPEENISCPERGGTPHCLAQNDMPLFYPAKFMHDSSHDDEGEELYKKEDDREQSHA